MSRPTSWLMDSNRFATKIRSASSALDPGKVDWKSNPSKSCPKCQHVIDNSDVVHAWPGLPQGVKFDPTDQEIIWHLLAQVGLENLKPHPFIDEFIPTVQEDDGICYTHPENLPGVRQDGSVSHFFHRAIKAYSTGTRKRRKIHGENIGDVRWHKTGRTKPVSLEGVQKGCKKIMVLYMSHVRGGKSEKTNWVMHQYHLGTSEDEMEGQYVVSKVFYQQQQQMTRKIHRSEEDVVPDGGGVGLLDATIPKVDPVTPKLVVPEPRAESRSSASFVEPVQDFDSTTLLTAEDHNESLLMRDMLETPSDQSDDQHQMINMENDANNMVDKNYDDDYQADDENGKWWDNESQYLLSSQQLLEGISICDELFQSQSPTRDEGHCQGPNSRKPLLSDYAHLGSEDLKRDLEECQNLVVDPANIELDTPPDFRLSQLEFESQDSYIAWGGSARGGKGD